jgi:hypothetical protein
MSSYPTYKPPEPQYRFLRVFAFDPSLDLDIQRAPINLLTLAVPWEKLEPGPIGEYLQVIDIDPASDACYLPIDLNDHFVLVQHGLPPFEGTPQFHQQMVYAVASNTIQNFEVTLGHKILWAAHTGQKVHRLRIYPHALRQKNAYYSSNKKALLFGYFPASTTDAGHTLPGGTVFTCLSKDIVTHETTHALLDGLHPYFNEPSNLDVLAFHEAFADIVALFQHFSQPEVVRNQIAQTRGDLYSDNLLSQFALQFGEATGKRGALRSAIGKDKVLQGTTEPHDRGAILVAAVFKAFVTIYNARTADLKRLATGGSGVFRPGSIHPDLVERLSREAAAVADRILRMCIRALNYCPPVDITFGEYLRALVTADYDLDQDDPEGYRIAMINSFRECGIYPPHVRSLSQASLLWATVENDSIIHSFFAENHLQMIRKFESDQRQAEKKRSDLYDNERKFCRALQRIISRELLQKYKRDPQFAKEIQKYESDPLIAKELIQKYESDLLVAKELIRKIDSDPPVAKELLQNYESDPRVIGEVINKMLESSINLMLAPDKYKQTIFLDKTGRPEIKVESARLAYRVDRSGWSHSYLVIELAQRRRGYLGEQEQKQNDQPELPKLKRTKESDFEFRGGVTMLIDTSDGMVKYVITKSVGSDRRLAIQRDYLNYSEPSMAFTNFGNSRMDYLHAAQGKGGDLFAMLHYDDPMEEKKNAPRSG